MYIGHTYTYIVYGLGELDPFSFSLSILSETFYLFCIILFLDILIFDFKRRKGKKRSFVRRDERKKYFGTFSVFMHLSALYIFSRVNHQPFFPFFFRGRRVLFLFFFFFS